MSPSSDGSVPVGDPDGSAPVSDPQVRPYDAARKWIEFVGEGSELDPLTLMQEGRAGFAFNGPFPLLRYADDALVLD
jgi:hypothetical protein